jgi:hypothetical protein
LANSEHHTEHTTRKVTNIVFQIHTASYNHLQFTIITISKTVTVTVTVAVTVAVAVTVTVTATVTVSGLTWLLCLLTAHLQTDPT